MLIVLWMILDEFGLYLSSERFPVTHGKFKRKGRVRYIATLDSHLRHIKFATESVDIWFAPKRNKEICV